MKLKLTLITMQVNPSTHPLSNDFLKILVDDEGVLPYKYVGTKNIEETLEELHNEFSNIDMGWNLPSLEGLRHEPGAGESEALYYSALPLVDGWQKNGKLITLNEIELEDFYERTIARQPRALQRY